MDTTRALEDLSDAMEVYHDRSVELFKSMQQNFEKRLDVLESKFGQELQALARLLTAPALPAPAPSSGDGKKKRIPKHLRECKTGSQVYNWHVRHQCRKLWSEVMASGKTRSEANEAVKAAKPTIRSIARQKKAEWLAKNRGKH